MLFVTVKECVQASHEILGQIYRDVCHSLRGVVALENLAELTPTSFPIETLIQLRHGLSNLLNSLKRLIRVVHACLPQYPDLDRDVTHLQWLDACQFMRKVTYFRQVFLGYLDWYHVELMEFTSLHPE